MGHAPIAMSRIFSPTAEMDNAAGLQRWLGSSASGRLSRLTRVNQTGVLAFRQPEQTGCDELILAKAIQRIQLSRRRSVLPFAVGSNISF